MDKVLEDIDRFAKEFLDFTRPVLVGVSGGVDSMALFEALCRYKRLSIAVAHVDHGWRDESAEEAEKLMSYVESKTIQFHQLRLNPAELQGNLENASRDCRYAYFKDLCEKHGYQGVLTAHHADDQAETVLKRVFEGGSLRNLAGIHPVRMIKGVKVFRPLLNLEKKVLEASVQEVSFAPFDDPTNADAKFLRARMRTKLLPMLQEEYGKRISSNLVLLGERIHEVNSYLDLQVDKYLSDLVKGKMGDYLELGQHLPIHPLELRHLLGKLLSQHRRTLSRSQLESLVVLLSQKKANKIIGTTNNTFFVDRGILFIPQAAPEVIERSALRSGRWGSWTVTVSHGKVERNDTWRECWKGNMAVALPEGDYQLGLANPNACFQGKSTISKWWSNHKAPNFLREYVPVIWQGSTIVHEFLTGASRPHGTLLVNLQYAG